MFRDVLGRYGVTPIESLGKIFNPEFQEAIAALNDPDKQPNSIIDELERGYMYQDKLLRPAKVVVSTR
jgi:molecular chaperone GrpE